MRVETYGQLQDGDAFDFVIIGSGFGGSVSALRLAEKGYSVAVLEAGRHFKDRDFATSNWQAHRFLWMPKLFLFGIQRLTLLKDILILGGAGVGGGSLVYANTLLEPGDGFYESAECRRLTPSGPGLKERLKAHYATAKRMLGVAPTPRLFPADVALKAVAEELGRGETFHSTNVGVYFGKPGETVADPYFGGEGPDRAGCIFCGGCMVGCRHNAKNTLAKNYLFLAVKRGARIFSLSTVRRINEREGAGGGFDVIVKRSGWGWGSKTLRAKRLVVSAGVLGTMRLLLSPENRLTRLPPRLGRDVRTNSEVLSGATARADSVDYSEGIAITSGMWPAPGTHVEIVRYSKGSDAMNLLAVRDRSIAGKPGDWLRTLLPFGWAGRTTILLFMQTADSKVRIGLKRFLGLFPVLTTLKEEGAKALPMSFPEAEDTLRRFSAKVDGVPQLSIGTKLNVSTTAHILGGAAMGTGPENGVTGLDGKVFGYDDLWVVDGSIIPANLGVNPSLTITALAEHAMAAVPPKSGAEAAEREPRLHLGPRISRLPELLLAYGALAGALVLNYYAGSYADRMGAMAHSSPDDLLFRLLPLVHMRRVYTWGFGAFITWAFIVAWWRERTRIPYFAWAYALLIAVRSFFIILTPMKLPAEGLHAAGDVLYDTIGKYLTFRNDLFFSSHTALPYLGFLVFRGRWIKASFLFFSLLMAATVLLGRMHYSIDVAGAYFITYAVYRAEARWFQPFYHAWKWRKAGRAARQSGVMAS